MRWHNFAQNNPSDWTESDGKRGDKGEDGQSRGDRQVGIKGDGEEKGGKGDDGGGEEEYPARAKALVGRSVSLCRYSAGRKEERKRGREGTGINVA